MPVYVLSHFQGLTLTVLILYCLTNPTLIKVFLLILVIRNGLTEEVNVSRVFWKRTFWGLSTIACTKIVLKSLFQLDTQSQTYSMFESTKQINGMIEFFCGGLEYETLEILAFLFTILSIV